MNGELEDAVVASTGIYLEGGRGELGQSLMTRPRFELGIAQMLHRSVCLIIVKLIKFLYLWLNVIKCSVVQPCVNHKNGR